MSKRIREYFPYYDLLVIDDSFKFEITYLPENTMVMSMDSENKKESTFYFIYMDYTKLSVESVEYKKKQPLVKVVNKGNKPLRLVYADQCKTIDFLERILKIKRTDFFQDPINLSTEQREQIWSDVSNGKYRDFEYQPKTKVIAPGESWYPDWEYYELIPRIL